MLPSRPTLRVVAEVYHFRETPPPWPWSLADTELGTYTHVNLSVATTTAEIGSVVATEVNGLQLEVGPTAHDWLRGLLGTLDDGPFSIRGGVVARDGEREVWPGCCCSVSGWQEWRRFATDGTSPWMGHDPTGWAEWAGDVARVWAGGGSTRTGEGEPVEFPRRWFEGELAGVERSLAGFVGRVGEWAAGLGFDDPAAVRRAFAAAVGLGEANG